MRETLCTLLVVSAAGAWLLGGARIPGAVHWGTLGALVSTMLAFCVAMVQDRRAARLRVLARVGRSELARHTGPALGNRRHRR